MLKCTTTCIYTTFFQPDISNFIDPIDITLTYELKSYQIKPTNDNTNRKRISLANIIMMVLILIIILITVNNFCKLCPIKYVGYGSKPIKLSVHYENSCAINKCCNSDISVTTSVQNLK